MEKFKFIDLFSGLGGFHLGLSRVGGECIFAAEIDKWASQSYEIVHNLKPHGDITKINEHDIPDHDVLAAGIPCQAFSLAGKRLGFADTRGTLFFEVARIIDAKKPKIVIIENVKGLVSHDKGQTITVMLESLSELGYTVDFELLNSKYFGVPQNRERVFIIAVLGQPEEEWKIKDKLLVSRRKKELIAKGTVKMFNFDFPSNDTVTTRLKEILEENPEPKYYLSQELQDRFIEKLKEKDREALEEIRLKKLGDLDIKGNDILKRVYDTEGLSPTLHTVGGGNTEPKILEVGNIIPSGRGQSGQVVSSEGLSPTLDTMEGGHRQPKIVEIGNINPSGNGIGGRVFHTNGLAPTVNATDGDKSSTPKIIEPQLKGDIGCYNPRKDDGTQSYQQDRIYSIEGVVPALCRELADQKIVENRSVMFANANMQGRRVKDNDEETFTLSTRAEQGIIQSSILNTLVSSNVMYSPSSM